MKPDSVLKSIVTAIRSREELSSVVCVYSDSREVAENPLCSFTLCLGLGRFKYTKESDTNIPEFFTSVKLSLLAPSGAGGKRLTEVAMWIAEAVRENLSVSLIEISEPKTIETCSVLCTDITIIVKDEITDEVSSCEVYIDGEKAECVISFDAENELTFEKHPELLNGYKFVPVNKNECSVRLKAKEILNLRNVFVLTLVADGYRETYKNCRVKRMNRQFNSWGSFSADYEITAEIMEVQGE